MKILVINCGSSSLKYQLIDMDNEDVIAKGLVERIGIDGSKITHEYGNDEEFVLEDDMPDHSSAIQHVFDALTNENHGVIKSVDEIDGIGHRVVHGGSNFTDSAVVNEEVKEGIREFAKFAPLHNPANIMGIEACEKIAPDKKNVVVFDTSFHQTMPAKTYMYAIPYELYEKHDIRKYGFHGTSHKFVAHRLAEIMDKPLEEINFINCHLGNGSSLAAIKNGKVYDTSMGLTPLDGLIMGTRSGTLDPTVISFLQEQENLSAQEVNDLLNKKSGVSGISGISSDFRDLEDAAADGNERAQLALDMFTERVRFYLGAYMAMLDGVDAITFTAGIGENSGTMRADICRDLEHLGIKIDSERNDTRKEALISSDDSKVKVYAIPTNEEVMIARDTLNLIK